MQQPFRHPSDVLSNRGGRGGAARAGRGKKTLDLPRVLSILADSWQIVGLFRPMLGRPRRTGSARPWRSRRWALDPRGGANRQVCQLQAALPMAPMPAWNHPGLGYCSAVVSIVAISARTIEGSRDCRPRATATATRTSARSLPFHTGLSHWPFTLALSHWPFTDLLSLTSFHWPFTGLLLPFTGLSLPFLFADVERSAQPDHKSGLGTHDLGREHTVLPGEPVSAALG